MGRSRESRHNLKKKVGMMSREQNELDDCVIADRTSSVMAEENSKMVKMVVVLQ